MVRNIIGGLALVGVFLTGILFGTWSHATRAALQEQPATLLQEHDKSTALHLFHHGERHGDRQVRGGLVGGALIKITAEVSGMTVTEVITELRGGQSLQQIIEAHGKGVDEVLRQFNEQAQQRLDTAVADGRLTQEQADAILQRVNDQAAQVINDETFGQKVEQYLERGVLLVLGRATADVTGLPPVTVLQRFRAGESLTAIAESEGKTRQEVLDAADVIYTNRQETAVTNGRITQEEADARRAFFNEMAEWLVDEVRSSVDNQRPNSNRSDNTP